MGALLRTVQFLAIGLWLGADVFLSFVVAPGAFHLLSSRDQAGQIVGYALTILHFGGLLCGLLFLLARLIRTRYLPSLLRPAALAVALMIILTAISQFTVSSRMAALRVQMGSIQATAAGNPLLAEFSRLHALSVSFESGVLLAGFAAIYLLVRETLPARD